jgi:hypothetical protein
MRQLLLGIALVLALAGCSSSSEESPVTDEEPPNRDGFSGQMGVMAGDPSDYGN